MTDAYRAAHAGIARRDFMIAGAGAAALGANLADAGTALAQAGPAPAAPRGPARPGNILVERRGSVLLIGIDRPDAQNRFDAPMLIGLGKAYYRLDRCALRRRRRLLPRRRPRGLCRRASRGPAPKDPRQR